MTDHTRTEKIGGDSILFLWSSKSWREIVMTVPIGKNGQRLVNFLEEPKDHYEQVKAFYGYNCNMLNNV